MVVEEQDRMPNCCTKYGVSNPDYLVPPTVNPRIGVDRDDKGNIIGAGAHTAKGLLVAVRLIDAG